MVSPTVAALLLFGSPATAAGDAGRIVALKCSWDSSEALNGIIGSEITVKQMQLFLPDL